MSPRGVPKALTWTATWPPCKGEGRMRAGSLQSSDALIRPGYSLPGPQLIGGMPGGKVPMSSFAYGYASRLRGEGEIDNKRSGVEGMEGLRLQVRDFDL